MPRTPAVSCWGRVVETARGWKSQFAYPASFRSAFGRRSSAVALQELAEAYGVPLS